jgi:hypothetical protein
VGGKAGTVFVATPTPNPSPQGGGERAAGAVLHCHDNHLYSHLYSSRIQVSLVPPPWLEFTTSEPSFSATRVNPPGTMVT